MLAAVSLVTQETLLFEKKSNFKRIVLTMKLQTFPSRELDVSDASPEPSLTGTSVKKFTRQGKSIVLTHDKRSCAETFPLTIVKMNFIDHR